jgi:LGFP repeat
MANKCVGGWYDGMPVYTREDARTCTEADGTVVSDPSGGPCSTESASAVGTHDAAQDVAPLARALALYGHTDEVRLLNRLNQEAAPVISRIMIRNDELAREVQDGLARLINRAARATELGAVDQLYTADDHAAFSALAQRVAAAGDSEALRQLTREAIAAAEPYIDLPANAVRERLGPIPDFAGIEPTTTERPFVVAPTAAVSLSHLLGAHNALMTAASESALVLDIGPLIDFEIARRAIEQKAASLGSLAEGSPGDVRQVSDGWVRDYPGCDIYYSEATGAHEVHGEIRRKYDAVNGPGWLGLPTTDESGTPDGRGRFNHFSRDASIYWTPSTGPMIVRGPIRAFWASQGWEQGPWGYPVGDEQRIPGLSPADAPNVAWSAFQNGVIFSQGAGRMPAVFASVTRQQVADAIRAMVDKRIKPVTVEIGLITATNQAGPRERRVPRRGGLVLRLLGRDAKDHQASPARLREHSGCVRPHIRARSVVAVRRRLADRLFPVSRQQDGGRDPRPVPHPRPTASYPTQSLTISKRASRRRSRLTRSGQRCPTGRFPLGDVPTGANQRGRGGVDFLDVMLMADGALRVFLNPIPPSLGALRQSVAQQRLDAVLSQF